VNERGDVTMKVKFEVFDPNVQKNTFCVIMDIEPPYTYEEKFRLAQKVRKRMSAPVKATWGKMNILFDLFDYYVLGECENTRIGWLTITNEEF
jgi:hypothetical protein